MNEEINDLIDEPVKNLFTQAIQAPAEEDFTNLLIVDVMNTAFRYKAAGTYVFADDMVRMIKSLAKSYECKNIVCCGDWVLVPIAENYIQNIKLTVKRSMKIKAKLRKSQQLNFLKG